MVGESIRWIPGYNGPIMSLESSRWKAGPRQPCLADGEIHVWRSSLDLPAAVRAQLIETLSQDELERASRFATDKLRHRYVAGRGILRSLLGSFLGRSPGSFEFHYGEHEKPSLAGAAAASGLQFNVSHSHDLGLFAFRFGGELGVDVERIRTNLEQTEIASRFFSASESAKLRSLPETQQGQYFFALWTCKEAFVKAHGGGITFGLSRFDVQLEPGAGSAAIVGNQEGEPLSPWYAHRFEPGPGFVGALVVEEREPNLSLWDWRAASLPARR
jgi:4'-phosphopantetheinyl transferase